MKTKCELSIFSCRQHFWTKLPKRIHVCREVHRRPLPASVHVAPGRDLIDVVEDEAVGPWVAPRRQGHAVVARVEERAAVEGVGAGLLDHGDGVGDVVELWR